jgi:hypothetical protein
MLTVVFATHAAQASTFGSGTNFTIVKNEEYGLGREVESRHLHILVDLSGFSDEAVIELGRHLELEYPKPDRLTVHVYSDPRQYPRDLFSRWRGSGDGSPFFYDYPHALMMRESTRFLFRITPKEEPRELNSYVFDREWTQLSADGV